MPHVTNNNTYSKNGGGHWGPFSVGGDTLVVFSLDAQSTFATGIIANYSTDGGVNWSAGAEADGGDRILCFWAEWDPVNEIFHTARHVDGGDVEYLQYNPSTNTWGSVETVYDRSTGSGFGVVLTLDASGDVWIQYQGETENVGGTDYRRVTLAHRTSANNYTEYDVDAGGTTHWTVADMKFDSNGLLHILYGSWQTRPWYRTFNPSTETFGTAHDLHGSNVTFTVNVSRRLALYEDGATMRVVCTYTGPSNYPYAVTIDNGSVGTPGPITSSAVNFFDSGRDANLTIMSDPDELTIYAAFVLASDQDAYYDSNVDDAGWGTDGALTTGQTLQAIDANLYVRNGDELWFGYIVDTASSGIDFYAFKLRDIVTGQTVDLDPATLDLAGFGATIQAGGVTVDLDPSAASVGGLGASVDTGEAVVPLDPATLDLAALGAGAEVGLIVHLDPATLDAEALSGAVAGGETTIDLDPATVQAVGLTAQAGDVEVVHSFVTANSPGGDNGGGHWGPHKVASGDLVVLGRLSTDGRYVRPHYSTDGGETWNEGTGHNFGAIVLAVWSEVDQTDLDLIHVAAHVTGGALYYNTYTPSTDSWGTPETVTTNPNGNSDGYGVAMKQHPATGNLWFFYQGEAEEVFSILRLRVYLTERTGASTYSTPLEVDHGAGENKYFSVGDMVIRSNEIHLFYGSWEPRVYYRTYNFTALSAPQEVSDSAAPFAVNVAKRVAYYRVSATDRITFSWYGPGAVPYASRADNGGTPEPQEAIGAAPAAVWDSDNSAAIMMVADEGESTVYLLYANLSDGDIYLSQNEDGAGWSTPTALITGVTARWVDATVYINDNTDLVIGILYDEEGTGQSFYEYVIRSLVGAPVLVDLDVATLANTAGTAGVQSIDPGTNVLVSLLPALLVAAGPEASTLGGDSTVLLDPATLQARGFRTLPRLGIQAYRWEFRVDWNGDGVYEADEAFRMVDLKVRRGRQDELAAPGGGFNQYREGECMVTLDNSDGRYDAWNTSSPLYPNVLPARRCYLNVSYANWTARIFTGVINDLVPSGRHDRVRLTIAEPPQIYAGPVNLPTLTGASVHDLFTLITAQAGANASRVGHSLDVLPYWWPTQTTYMGCLQDLATAMGDDVFIDAYGRVQYLVHGWGGVESWSLEEDQILKDLEINQPWLTLRNRVAVESAQRTRGDVAVLWTLPDTPSLAQGDVFETEAIFADETGQVPALGVLTPVAGVDFQANTAADGSGTDVTSRFTVSLEAYGARAVVRVTYTGSGGNVYLTLLQVRGEPLSATNSQTVVRRDTTSVSRYGERSLTLTSPLVQSYGYAMPRAEILLARYKDPRLNPVIQLESLGQEVQFAAELGRLLTLSIDSLGINEDMRIAGISHEWKRDTGQSILTTYWLEPWVSYGSYWHFSTVLNSTSRLGG